MKSVHKFIVLFPLLVKSYYMGGMRILKSTSLDARRALQLYTVRRLLFRLVSTLLCLLASGMNVKCMGVLALVCFARERESMWKRVFEHSDFENVQERIEYVRRHLSVFLSSMFCYKY